MSSVEKKSQGIQKTKNMAHSKENNNSVNFAPEKDLAEDTIDKDLKISLKDAQRRYGESQDNDV